MPPFQLNGHQPAGHIDCNLIVRMTVEGRGFPGGDAYTSNVLTYWFSSAHPCREVCVSLALPSARVSCTWFAVSEMTTRRGRSYVGRDACSGICTAHDPHARILVFDRQLRGHSHQVLPRSRWKQPNGRDYEHYELPLSYFKH